ncbi:phage baseplate assembly protein V [Biomaibacter acetigenes]|uniref:phage baseplate assembly protein V n=1 Tax=Biomaibacter acetigenes TaxID=2316383 RepID=UPI001CA3C978|nr:phage baseplate assembly protein V [Biomaibacter acetigenes]
MDGYRLPELKPKIYGKYRGIVVVGKDPEGKGRVKVQVPALFGFKTIENWAYPVLPPQFVGIDIGGGKLQLDWETMEGSTFIREILPKIIGVDPSSWEIPTGTGVWVEFEGGDPDKPLWCGFWR